MEKRSINFELRAKPESRTIFGTATVFNSAYDMGWYDEEMSAEALKDSDLKDVVALFNHDMNMVLARTSSGTLKLNVTDSAREYEFEAPNTTLGNDLLGWTLTNQSNLIIMEKSDLHDVAILKYPS